MLRWRGMVPAQFTGSAFGQWVSRCCRSLEEWAAPRKPLDPRHALGARGEKLAARHLRRRGYKVLYRNFRARGGGEVDIVCRHGQTLVFVEVKTRSGLAYGRPGDAVDLPKQRLIIRGALAWLKLLRFPDIVFRFDIVEVLVDPTGAKRPEIEVIESAFSLPEHYRYSPKRLD